MQAVTVSLGNELCKFSQMTCSAFENKELRKEYNAQIHCEANAAAKKVHGATDLLNSADEAHPAQTNPTGSLVSDSSPVQPGPSGQCLKTFNLSTYKGHSLGDYVDTIRQYGTSDSYLTEPVCIQYFSFSFQLIFCLKG